MVLPLGPPNRQYIMEVVKTENEDGSLTLSRRDVYNGLSVKFIPFRDDRGASYSTPVPEPVVVPDPVVFPDYTPVFEEDDSDQ